MMSGGDDCFNPPPPLARWRMTDRSLKNPLYAVSIRPHRSRGGGSEHVTTNPPEDLFQSAPTARAVEDNITGTITTVTNLFQSAPTARAVEDNEWRRENGIEKMFQSAPTARAVEDSSCYGDPVLSIMFQSAPTARAVEDD